jgi:hypothetical protein
MGALLPEDPRAIDRLELESLGHSDRAKELTVARGRCGCSEGGRGAVGRGLDPSGTAHTRCEAAAGLFARAALAISNVVAWEFPGAGADLEAVLVAHFQGDGTVFRGCRDEVDATFGFHPALAIARRVHDIALHQLQATFLLALINAGKGTDLTKVVCRSGSECEALVTVGASLWNVPIVDVAKQNALVDAVYLEAAPGEHSNITLLVQLDVTHVNISGDIN